MLCQSCHKNTATTHIKSIVNGELTEYALCSECAKKLGYNHFFGSFADDFVGGLGSLLGGFFGGEAANESVTRCRKCGASFEEISRSGKVGCAECYRTFRNQLLPSIQRIHGKPKTPLEEKKEALQKAIQEQNFEQAAVLRDEIREMEGKQ